MPISNNQVNKSPMLARISKVVPKSIRRALIRSTINILRANKLLPTVANSYSQAGEDRILTWLFDQMGIHKPTYLDVGTCHPSSMNNTYLFYQRGAAGVCVEPNPELAPVIREARPRDKVLNAGLSTSKASECAYYMFAEPSLNTFDAEQAKARAQSGKNPIVREISVPILNINNVVSEHFPGGLDLLSLDAEGLDLPLLQALDFTKCRPIAICVETVGYSESLAKPKGNEFTTLLNNMGYGVFADTFINTIYIDLKRTGTIAL